MQLRAWLFFLATPLAVGVACYTGPNIDYADIGNRDAAASSCEGTLASIQVTIFDAKCVSCHGGATPSGGLDLSSAKGGAGPRLVNASSLACRGAGGGDAGGLAPFRSLVVPGDPEGSYLLHKISDPSPACGDPMPVGAPLTAKEVACVRTWIASLTPDGGPPPPPADCLPEQIACGRTCVDARRDPANCGACGKTCDTAAGSACEYLPPQGADGGADAGAGKSQCVNACTNPGEVKVGGACVDPQRDPLHCGPGRIACDLAKGETCVAGACGCAPDPGFPAVLDVFADPGPTSCLGGGCHGTKMVAAGLNLDPSGDGAGSVAAVHASLLGASTACGGKKRVQPGSVAQSLLMDKVTFRQTCGTRMPQGVREALTEDQRNVLRDWICNGAKNP